MAERREATHHVEQSNDRRIFTIEPIALIEPLTEQLDGRLTAVLLLARHIQIIDEDDALLAQRWPVDTFSTSGEKE
jgi:hypothetical protein